jgi:dTDP-4-dehydrorhamnose reductase
VNVVITGGGGQLARELVRTAPAGWPVSAQSRAMLDIADAAAVRACLGALRPDVVINTAAFTRVDDAELERECAFRVNAQAPLVLADACTATGARLLHVSTDYVFDGPGGTPWRVDAPTTPRSVYGKSKLAGERALAGRGAAIVRVSWLYGAHGRNFLRTMLRLMAERREVSVVTDQVGSPTWAEGLARMLWSLALRPDVGGVLHWCDAGAASWFDFATAIRDVAVALGMLPAGVEVRPITSTGYPQRAPRPAYSVLDCSATVRLLGQPQVPWRVALGNCLARLHADGGSVAGS